MHICICTAENGQSYHNIRMDHTNRHQRMHREGKEGRMAINEKDTVRISYDTSKRMHHKNE